MGVAANGGTDSVPNQAGGCLIHADLWIGTFQDPTTDGREVQPCEACDACQLRVGCFWKQPFQSTGRSCFIVACLMMACGLSGFALSSPAHAAAEKLPTVLPVGANPFGASYAEWSARWWQWALSLPADAHPLLDSAGCDAGQSGLAWFLGGSFADATVVRDCTVPAGKPIFFPVLNTECSTIEGPPFFGGNEAELRDCAATIMDTAVGLFTTIDGVAVQNLSSFRVQSPLYEFSAPDGGLFGGAVTGASVSDGVYLMLAPLSAGAHTIHFGGTQTFGTTTLTLDVTYNLTVMPGGRGRGGISSGPESVEASWGLVKKLYR